MIIFCWWRHGEKSITTSWHLFQNTVILRRPRVASFADVIKVATTLIKTIFKDSKKLKESEIMYQNAIYIRISRYSKICWFPVIKCWCQQNLVPIFFGSPLGKVITVPSFFIGGYVRQILERGTFSASTIGEESWKGPFWIGWRTHFLLSLFYNSLNNVFIHKLTMIWP